MASVFSTGSVSDSVGFSFPSSGVSSFLRSSVFGSSVLCSSILGFSDFGSSVLGSSVLGSSILGSSVFGSSVLEKPKPRNGGLNWLNENSVSLFFYLK